MSNGMLKVLVAVVLLAVAAAAVWVGRTEYTKHQAKEQVRTELTDPDSAKFRGLAVYDGAVCGQVNAKNRMGGYVGYREFVALRGVDFVDMQPGDEPGAVQDILRDSFQRMQDDLCR